MKLNNIKIGTDPATLAAFKNPVLKIGDKIDFLYTDDEIGLPGSKNLTKGKYVIVQVKPSVLMPFLQVYVMKHARSNATHEFHYITSCIDKAINLNLIKKI